MFAFFSLSGPFLSPSLLPTFYRLWAPVPCPLLLPHHQTSANSFHQLQTLLQLSVSLIISKSPITSLSSFIYLSTSLSLWLSHLYTLSDHYLIPDPPSLGTPSPFIAHVVHSTTHTGSTIHQFHGIQRLERFHWEVFWRKGCTSRFWREGCWNLGFWL